MFVNDYANNKSLTSTGLAVVFAKYGTWKLQSALLWTNYAKSIFITWLKGVCPVSTAFTHYHLLAINKYKY